MIMTPFEAAYTYLGFGVLWVSTCILIKAMTVDAEKPLLSLLFMISIWPYLLWRIVKNIIAGKPNGPIWP